MNASSQGNHVDLDTWLDFVHGLLDPAVQRRALEHAKTCLECEAEFRSTAASNARARAVAAGESAVIAPVARPPIHVRRLPRWAWGAAAAAILVVAIELPRSNRPPEQRPLAPAMVLPAPKLRGASRGLLATTADSAVVQGLEAYDRGDFALARALLSKPTSESMELVRRVYLGSALLELNDAPGACRILQTANSELIPEPWKSESRWNLARAFAIAGNGAARDSLLHVLAAEDGEVAARARAALHVVPSR